MGLRILRRSNESQKHWKGRLKKIKDDDAAEMTDEDSFMLSRITSLKVKMIKDDNDVFDDMEREGNDDDSLLHLFLEEGEKEDHHHHHHQQSCDAHPLYKDLNETNSFDDDDDEYDEESYAKPRQLHGRQEKAPQESETNDSSVTMLKASEMIDSIIRSLSMTSKGSRAKSCSVSSTEEEGEGEEEEEEEDDDDDDYEEEEDDDTESNESDTEKESLSEGTAVTDLNTLDSSFASMDDSRDNRRGHYESNRESEQKTMVAKDVCSTRLPSVFSSLLQNKKWRTRNLKIVVDRIQESKTAKAVCIQGDEVKEFLMFLTQQDLEIEQMYTCFNPSDVLQDMQDAVFPLPNKSPSTVSTDVHLEKFTPEYETRQKQQTDPRKHLARFRTWPWKKVLRGNRNRGGRSRPTRGSTWSRIRFFRRRNHDHTLPSKDAVLSYELSAAKMQTDTSSSSLSVAEASKSNETWGLQFLRRCKRNRKTLSKDAVLSCEVGAAEMQMDTTSRNPSATEESISDETLRPRFLCRHTQNHGKVEMPEEVAELECESAMAMTQMETRPHSPSVAEENTTICDESVHIESEYTYEIFQVTIEIDQDGSDEAHAENFNTNKPSPTVLNGRGSNETKLGISCSSDGSMKEEGNSSRCAFQESRMPQEACTSACHNMDEQYDVKVEHAKFLNERVKNNMMDATIDDSKNVKGPLLEIVMEEASTIEVSFAATVSGVVQR